ncbi:Ig-like domain-containing protein [Shewanella glacialipiscicola]|uniref:Ig-like domain-containing protein n=1 Tax=Shewanella glacialipiscicola TaxID=614069 RepID=UPI003D7A13BD
MSQLSFIKRALLLGLGYTSSFNVMAAIEGYSFLDTASKEKSVSTPLINPINESNIYLSAGLDNKLSVSVLNGSGVSVHSQTTDFVRVSDRLNFSGRDFYGKILVLPKITDGTYNLKVETINSLGKIIDTYSQPLTIDTVGPAFGEWYGASNGAYGSVTGSEPVWFLATQPENSLLYLLDVHEVVTARAVVKNADTGVVIVNSNMIINSVTNQVSINSGSSISGNIPANNATQQYTLQAELSDAAGNISYSSIKPFYLDNYSGAPSAPIAVFDPDATAAQSISPSFVGFVPYKAGMAVKTNPIRILYQVPIDNVRDAGVLAGLAIQNSVGTVSVTTDSKYGYFDMTAPYNYTGANQIKWVDFGRWIAGTIQYNLTLDPVAPESPVVSSMTYILNGQQYNYGGSIYHQNTILPATMTNFQLVVQPREYAQTATLRGYVCNFPAGETTCVFDGLKWDMITGGAGYLHDPITLTSTGLPTGTLYANITYGEPTYNDLYYPILNNFEFNAVTNVLTAFVTQPAGGSWFERLNIKSAVIQYGGNTLTAIKTVRNLTNWEFTYDLNSIAVGNHALELKIVENHGATTIAPLMDFNIEKSAPLVTITNDGSQDFSQIVGLDNLVLGIKDDSDYTIDSVVISGGASNDTVYLATVNQGNHKYNLQYPRLFPSLEANEIYKLTATVTDVFGNKGVASKSFTYQPPNLVNAGSMTTLAVAKNISNDSNKPVAEIVVNDLRTVEGQLAEGVQAALFTLRSDAAISVNVLGTVVNAGDTVTISPIATSGVIKFSVYPAVNGEKGKANFLFELLEVKSNI